MNLRPHVRRLARLAVAGTIAATAFAPTAASARDFDPLPTTDRLALPGTKPCESKIVTPKFCLPDYVVHVSSRFSYPTTYEGQDATFFYLTVRNTGLVGGSSLFTTVSIDEHDIVRVEPVWGDYRVRAFPVPEVGSDANWVIEHLDGLAPDEFSTFRVWVNTHSAYDFAATTNRHLGVDVFGYTRPAGYPQRDGDTSNNSATGWYGFD